MLKGSVVLRGMSDMTATLTLTSSESGNLDIAVGRDV